MDGSSEHDARLLVRGGRRLEGEVVLSGAKNSALKLLAASLLTTDPCVIRRVPRITDVATMVTMLRALGAEVAGAGDLLEVRAGDGLTGCAPYELVRTMRASIIVMGPLVARLGEATIAMPGGCNIGPRRIDFHIRGLEKLGARIDIEHGFIRVHSTGLRGAVVPLDYPSVGATENLVMAATAAEGETVIENAAREPEIMDLCAFLCGMGAEIEGAGTSTIRIAGGRPLHGVDHTVIADRIEAGTYLLMGAATSGRVTTVGLDPAHLELFLTKLRAMGVRVEEGEGAHHRGARRPARPRSTSRRSRTPGSRPTCRRRPWSSSRSPKGRRSSPRTCLRTGSSWSTSSTAWAPASRPAATTRSSPARGRSAAPWWRRPTCAGAPRS